MSGGAGPIGDTNPLIPLTHPQGRMAHITLPEHVAFPIDGVSAIAVTRDGHIHILDVREINGLEQRPARRGKAA